MKNRVLNAAIASCMSVGTSTQIVVVDDYNMPKTTYTIRNYIPEGDLIDDYTKVIKDLNAPKFGGAFNCKKSNSKRKKSRR